MAATLHLAGMLLTAAVSLAVARWVREQTRDHAGTVMVLLLLVHAGMAVLAAGHLLADGRSAQVAFFQLRYLLALFAFSVWLLFAIYYTGRTRWLTRPVWAVLVGLPVVVGAVWITDAWHGLMVAEYQFHAEPFTYVRPEYTPLSGWLAGPLVFFPIFALGLLLRLFLFSRRTYRWQTGGLVAGMVAVFATSALAESSLVPAPGFGYGIFGSAVFAVVVALALFRTRMFAVLPLARNAVFESIDDAIVIVDADHRIVDYNGPAAELLPDVDGRVDEPLESAYPALVAPGDGSRNDGGGARAIVDRVDGALDSPFAGTVEGTRDGETRTLRVSVSEIASGGEPRGYALIMRDVTDLEAYAETLETRTEELEAKTARLEQFASVLSHDLRNPVAVATGYVQQTIDTGDASYAEEALPALERIDATIGTLLTLSREGESIDDPDPVALGSVADLAWETSDTADATLANEVPDDHRCYAAPDRLRTLLENVYRNAVDHGGSAVRIGLDDDGFFVADDGPGVPPDERERIFEYGYSRSGEGTGLGLAIVAAVAEAHGWEVRMAESETGGARIEVTGVEAVSSVTETTS